MEMAHAHEQLHGFPMGTCTTRALPPATPRLDADAPSLGISRDCWNMSRRRGWEEWSGREENSEEEVGWGRLCLPENGLLSPQLKRTDRDQ